MWDNKLVHRINLVNQQRITMVEVSKKHSCYPSGLMRHKGFAGNWGWLQDYGYLLRRLGSTHQVAFFLSHCKQFSSHCNPCSTVSIYHELTTLVLSGFFWLLSLCTCSLPCFLFYLCIIYEILVSSIWQDLPTQRNNLPSSPDTGLSYSI